ncbi:MarR family transcriptional regulator [Cellulomonas sp. NPDC089187]|uniref:MarR family winged helix-turn-helix transcriptional regulator n=1 Tax=Cellulomonas sp. NPDC089187 TaxID=3154970 RepID=UPI003446C160
MTGSRLRTAHPDPDQSPGLALWHVATAWQRVMRDALAPHGLTHVQYVLLAMSAAAREDESLTQHELASRAGTDVMMTSQVLRRLERAQLIERLPHPHDGRARLIRATEAGVALVNSATRDVESADSAYFATLGADSAAFLDLLHRLRRGHPIQ